jgi:hypothetical protein
VHESDRTTSKTVRITGPIVRCSRSSDVAKKTRAPGVWGVEELLVTAAPSDRRDRKHLITVGVLLQASGLAVITAVHTFVWIARAGKANGP